MSCCKGANSHIFPTLFATGGLERSMVSRSYNLLTTLEFQRIFAETQVYQGFPLLLESKRLVAGSIPAGGAKKPETELFQAFLFRAAANQSSNCKICSDFFIFIL